MPVDLPEADSRYVQDAAELRSYLGRSLEERAVAIVRDSAAVYAFAGLEHVEADDRTRLADLLLQLLINTVRDGKIETRGATISGLTTLLADKNVALGVLFHIVYLMERSAVDELALDDSFGASSHSWPAIVQTVHRSSFDVCAGLMACLAGKDGDAGIVDSLTTLHTRTVFLAALKKEIHRSERYGHPFALILLDVDRLAEINATHGYGAGDRVIERVGIVVRNYFRDTDWVARTADDSIAVILPEIESANAERLAERIRTTVEERLELHDYKSEQQSPVTVSVGVVIAEAVDDTVRAEQLLLLAEEAVARAKNAGRNRVVRVDATVGS